MTDKINKKKLFKITIILNGVGCLMVIAAPSCFQAKVLIKRLGNSPVEEACTCNPKNEKKLKKECTCMPKEISSCSPYMT